MYRLVLDITNVDAQAATDAVFRVQLLIDAIPVGWIKTPPLSLQPSSLIPSLTTPWLPAGVHTIRLAWLDDYAAGKLLGINAVILQRIDGADLDLSGVADWEEWVLDQGYDTDADTLTDAFELSFQPSSLSPLSLDTDGDTLGDGEELTIFGTDPLAVDSDTNGIPDAVLVGRLHGVQTAYRQVQHITSVWKEDGNTLYNPKSGIMIGYDFTITNAGMYRVAFDLRNYHADAPDDYRFKVQVYVNGFSIGTRYVLADLDLAGVGSVTTPWLTPGTHRVSLRWLNDSDTDGRITTIAIDEVRLYAFDAPDADGDGMQDWQAAALQNAGDSDGDGLSDYVEVTVHGTSPVLKDSDGDGINDNVELSLGLNPTNPDTDGDGVDDFAETEIGTDPLAAEFDGTATDVAVINGSATNAACGSWEAQGANVIAWHKRGWVEYVVNCTAADVYQLTIEATHIWPSTCNPMAPVATSDFLVYADGRLIGRQRLNTPAGLDKTLSFFTPWLEPGQHTVRIQWENLYSLLSLNLKEVRLQRLGGPDSDADGVKDWVENYLGHMTGLDHVPESSVVSPVCIEGIARYVDMMSIAIGDADPILAQPGTWRRWYADADLSPTGTTDIVVSFQNGAVSIATNIEWTVLNLCEAPNLRIRKGDSLKLTAVPEGATNGVVTIAVGGVTNYSFGVEDAVVHTFDEAGEYSVTGEHEDGTLTSRTITVTVVEAVFPPDPPACMLGFTRAWKCPDIPSGVVIDCDSKVKVVRSGDILSIRQSAVIEKRHLLARLHAGGPILARTPLDGFWLQAGVDTYLSVVASYEDSELWEQRMVAWGLPEDVAIEISIFIGGVTFEDMTTLRWITSEDLDESGEYTFRMIHPNSVSASVCHRIKAYENGLYLGEAYYAGILFPEE